MIANFILTVKACAFVLLPLLLAVLLMLFIMSCLVYYMPYPLLYVPIGIMLFLVLIAGHITWIEWLMDHNIF